MSRPSDVTLDLAGKVALVTGAAGGLGRAFCAHLTAAGAAVAGVDERPIGDDLALTVDGDVAQLDDVRRIVDTVVAALGGVDLLVNNSERWKQTPIDMTREQALADFHELFDSTTRGAFLVQRAVVGAMIERGGGDIVNVSITDILPAQTASRTDADPSDTDLYAASKWALTGFTQAWALTLHRHGIRVNTLAVGATDDPKPPARLLLDLLAEGPDGRTGETIGVWDGKPIALPPRRQRGENIV